MDISIDNKLTVHEVIALRKANGWDYDEHEWETCLKQNLINVSARNSDGEVIGVGFLCGNRRHAELVDLVVHPDYRQRGLGRGITRIVTQWAKANGIKYLGLTYDKNSPWLKEFYESEGFESIDFAMWHRSSLN